jgi:hypothetical protein
VECSRSIEKVEIGTGREIVLLEDRDAIVGTAETSAPGIGAVSFAAHQNTVTSP